MENCTDQNYIAKAKKKRKYDRLIYTLLTKFYIVLKYNVGMENDGTTNMEHTNNNYICYNYNI